MTPENFCYWLQGFFEISRQDGLDEDQVHEIRNHLKLVFNKVTPSIYNLPSTFPPYNSPRIPSVAGEQLTVIPYHFPSC